MITAKGITLKETTMQEDTYYRGYRLSSNEGQTDIYKDSDHLETVTLETKGRCRTTTDAARDIVDSWMVAP